MSGLAKDLWQSFGALPVWVQIWVAFVLVPTNLASLAFVNQPSGTWIALLAVGAMAANMPVMIYDRGFSKLMAFPHLLPWSALVLWLAFARPVGSSAYETYLGILLVVDAISLAFDYPDAIAWWKGNREPARPDT